MVDPEGCAKLNGRLQGHARDPISSGLSLQAILSQGILARLFPFQGVARENNYQGELDYQHQARAQTQSRQLRIEDGWLYFFHGWSQVIAQVLHLKLMPELFEKLKTTADRYRST